MLMKGSEFGGNELEGGQGCPPSNKLVAETETDSAPEDVIVS